MIYSPLPPNEYAALEDAAQSLFDNQAEWNLHYLLDDRLDDKIKVSDDYPSSMQILWACHLTCETYPEIVKALTVLPPAEAIEVIKTQNKSKMLPIYALLGERMFASLSSRAGLTSSRGILSQDGNVLTVNFGGHFLSLPKPETSTIIMPVSFDRH